METEVISQPFLGVFLHAVGGLCSAVFYLPYRRVVNWGWESYWLVGGFFSWIIAPLVVAHLIVHQPFSLISAVPVKTLLYCYLFGAIWGIGGLMFGLTVRYLGVALGVAMALGYCAVFGTIMPPIIAGDFIRIATSPSGAVVLVGVVVCLLGIGFNGYAGLRRDRGLGEEEKKKSVAEFDFTKGVIVATFCGIFSASMSYGFAAGKPLASLAVENGVPALWSNLPVLIVILWGGFTTNFIWCAYLNLKNGSWVNYLNKPGESGDKKFEPLSSRVFAKNIIFSAIAGTTWYMQFFFYGMGTSRMGRFEFSSWTLHMASIIFFGTLCGILLKEWQGVEKRTWTYVYVGLVTLVLSTMIVGFGNYMDKM